MTLFGCILAYNEAAIIGDAIDSLWAIGCDRVIVVDGKYKGFDDTDNWCSTDGTPDVARAHGAEVITAPGRCWDAQVEARNQYLLGQEGDWYLICDADERARGVLPDLSGEIDTYRVLIDGPVTGPPIQGTRLFRHKGRMAYHNRHYTLYSDGMLYQAKEACRSYWLFHIDRQDPHRQELKAKYYPREWARENLDARNNPMPVIKHMPDNPLPAVRYIGKGGWVPGLPAKDLDEQATLIYYDLLVANLASANPLYELVQPAPAAEPALSETDDEPDESESPDDEPAQSKSRRKGRKE